MTQTEPFLVLFLMARPLCFVNTSGCLTKSSGASERMGVLPIQLTEFVRFCLVSAKKQGEINTCALNR